MKRSCGSAKQFAHPSSYVEDALAALATDNSDRSAEQPAPSAETLQVPDELNQATDTQTEEQGDPTEQQGESTSALLAAYALGRASMTTDAERRKSECAKIRMPCKTGVLSMLWTAANNGTIAALDEKQKESTTVQAAAAANHSKTAATDDLSKPSIDAIEQGVESTLLKPDGAGEIIPASSTEFYAASADRYTLLSFAKLGYTLTELALIANSKNPDVDGNPKRTLVRDIQGRCYTMPGMSRCVGDFTVHADFLLSKFQEPDFNPLWIRQPDSYDLLESICEWTPEPSPKQMTPVDERVCRVQNKYVRETRKGRLGHVNGMPIRPNDTVGMFCGGMTLRFSTEEDILKETELPAIAAAG